MSCAASVEPLVIEKVIATQGLGNSEGELVAEFYATLPGRLMHCTLAVFPRGRGGAAAPSNYNNSGQAWTLTAQTAKGDDLNAMFTARALPNSWELESGIRRVHGEVTLISQVDDSGMRVEVIVQATFEPADGAMSTESVKKLYQLCSLSVGRGGQPLSIANGE